MAENLSMPATSTDPDLTQCFLPESFRSNTDASAITIDTSKDVWRHCKNAIQKKSKEWTDEKHNMYLNSLEASFVEELYNSNRFGGWGVKKNSCTPYSSDQFVVLGDGCWKKINYEKKEPLLSSAAESRLVMHNQWIRHFSNSNKRRTLACSDKGRVAVCSNETHSRGKPERLCGSASGLEYNPVCHKCHQDLCDSTAEVSDQNFMEDISGVKPSCKSVVKRLKTAASDDSNNDQIVPSMPSKKFHAADASIAYSISSNRDKQGCHELLSKHPENYVCPKSDGHYYLRGS
ncbi:cold-regulated protein 27-like isoform X2 [Humulus lupulus]|uniref:cold-regulated protein 27-like isoform X2 n=1 Tax=Humulus lupulus TaxID=3486 RepID=UPI002B407AC4|nr:cold-regulated protein 27-like isoform X2 [Humulus lupulus]